MKFSTIMVVFAAALCVAGCKYSKLDGDDAANASDISAAGNDIAGDENGYGNQGLGAGANGQSGSLDGLGERHFEGYLQRCTDVSFSPVYFGFDSTVVPQGELGKIDEVVRHLQAKTDRVVVVEGNCDDRGSNEYNMSLGENRAIIIRNYLVQSGIAGDRIQTRSYGEEKPAAEGNDESAWALNRRGEFAIFQR